MHPVTVVAEKAPQEITKDHITSQRPIKHIHRTGDNRHLGMRAASIGSLNPGKMQCNGMDPPARRRLGSTLENGVDRIDQRIGQLTGGPAGPKAGSNTESMGSFTSAC